VLLTGGCGNLTLSHAGSPPLGKRVRSGEWVRAVRDVRLDAAWRGQSFPRAALSAIYQGLAPRAVKRWRVHRRNGKVPWLAYSVVSSEFLSAIDYESHAQAVGHDVPFDLPYNEKEIRLRLLQAQRGMDFQGFVRRNWKFEGRDPYRDRRLVEFCLGIPAEQYWRDGQNRWLARRTLADRVPAETLAQRKRGRQSPEWYTTASKQLDTMTAAIDRLARSPLASQVIDVPRMRTLLNSWPKDARAAQKSVDLHGHALQRGIAMGGFLRWYEGRND
jgi:asparagine synthase (glutamine-hydrolysing)